VFCSERQKGLCRFGVPSHPRLFQALLQYCLVSAFNSEGSDTEKLALKVVIVVHAPAKEAIFHKITVSSFFSISIHAPAKEAIYFFGIFFYKP
jgi:hypothetical protein